MNEGNQGNTVPTVTVAVAMLILLALVVGGLYLFAYSPLTDTLDGARLEASERGREADALREQNARLGAELETLRQTVARLEGQVEQRDVELNTFRSTQQQLLAVFRQEIADGQIRVQQIRDRLRVDLVNEILFNSGEVALNPEGMDVLRRVGEILSEASDRQIIVQGHTDNVRIGGRLAERFATNWELSAARAVNVVRFLENETAVDPGVLSAAAFSEYRPRAANDTQEGRQANRRIEIVLAPLPAPVTSD